MFQNPISVFSFRGRIGRLEWWVVALLVTVIWSAYFAMFGVSYFGILTMRYFTSEAQAQQFLMDLASRPTLLAVGLPTIGILSIWLNLAALAKRYHDRDKSAWWILIVLIPFIGTIWQFIECGFLSGTPGTNSYGADRRSREFAYDELAGYDVPSSMRNEPEPRWSRNAEPTVQPARQAWSTPAETAPRRVAPPSAFGKRGR